MSFDLILRNGRLIDPASSIDAITDVAFTGGKVAAVGTAATEGQGHAERDVSGCIVMPGMIDFHTHVYWGGTSISVDADQLARRCGTTTWLDVGSAGPGNFAGFRKHVIEPSQTRILAYLHVSHAGIFAFSPQIMVGESQDMRLMDTETCARVAKENPDTIRGIKVRVGAGTSGVNGIAPLYHALEAADRAGLPVMCHIDRPPPRYVDVLELLRPGDTLTHCFKPFPNAPITADGRIKEACWKARERGVIFDIGHGKGSFDFNVARAMLDGGFPPDIISSDVHVLCIDGPAFDNMETIPQPRHAVGGHHPRRHRNARENAGPAGSRRPHRWLHRRRHGDAHRGWDLHLHRRAEPNPGRHHPLRAGQRRRWRQALARKVKPRDARRGLWPSPLPGGPL